MLKDKEDTAFMLAKYHIKPKIIFSEFWRLNFSCKHVDVVCNSHGFCRSVIIVWAKYNYHEVEDVQDIIVQRLWGNSQILVRNKPIFNKNLIEKGIFTILDLYDDQKGHLRTYQDICNMIGNVNFLDYLSILSAIPHKWKKAIACLSPSILDISFNMTIDKMMDTEKISKKIYENLLEDNQADNSIIRIWAKSFNLPINENDLKNALNTLKAIQILKYKSFQCRLIWRAILLNHRLYYCNISNTQMCSFSKLHKKNYEHFFINCEVSQSILSRILDYFDYELSKLTYKQIIVGVDQDPRLNCILIIVKQNLCAAKCLKKQPKYLNILHEIFFIRDLELHKATNVKQKSKAHLKWHVHNDKMQNVNE